MKKTILFLLLVSLSAISIFAKCFDAKESTMEIAQQIRQQAKDMGWKVGKVKSISIAGIIKGKKTIYPDGNMEICLKEKDGDLQYIMNSSSKDAEKAEWHFLKSSKKGWF